jgi:MFS family permease
VTTAESSDYRGRVYVVLATRCCGILALSMQSVAVGWDVYAATHRPLDLGFVGLVQFVPSLLLLLVAGEVADRVNRGHLMVACYVATAIISAALYLLDPRGGLTPMYAALFMQGAVRSFALPAGGAVLPSLVPRRSLAKYLAQSSTVTQLAVMAGPALGGVLYGAIGRLVYLVCMGLMVVATVSMARISIPNIERGPRGALASELFAGIRYVWKTKLVLAALSLDLFAVFLGGAVALLPVYASDILRTGPLGLGFLRSAPSVGALFVGAWLGRFPIKEKNGPIMLMCVALFGASTIVFGLSTSFALSLVALAAGGAVNMVAIVMRQTLVLLHSPEQVRGRVTAVKSVFSGVSNELGDLESGVTATWFGVVPAVVMGGIGTIVVAAIWAWRFPTLARVDRLEPAPHSERGAVESEKAPDRSLAVSGLANDGRKDDDVAP